MRALHALLRVLRLRVLRRDRHPRPEPDASTDRPGLADLLEAARAPGTPDELAGEKEVVAAFVAHRRRAARAQRRTPARIRAALVPATTGLALLILTGTAVAARTGNLPQEAQQHAHRLFSALGVPAPRTGTPTPDITNLTWCEAWHGVPGRTLSQDDHRRLAAAAGPQGIDRYCVDLRRTASHKPSPANPATGSPRKPASPAGVPPRSLPPPPSSKLPLPGSKPSPPSSRPSPPSSAAPPHGQALPPPGSAGSPPAPGPAGHIGWSGTPSGAQGPPIDRPRVRPNAGSCTERHAQMLQTVTIELPLSRPENTDGHGKSTPEDRACARLLLSRVRGGHHFGPTNSSRRATASRRATDSVFGRAIFHAICSWSRDRAHNRMMSVDSLTKL